ncbi:hypothetical protein JCM16106_06910 [Hydrogenophilus islandicus]
MRFAIALLLVINALLVAVQTGIVKLPEPPRPQPIPQPLRSDALRLVRATVTEYGNKRGEPSASSGPTDRPEPSVAAADAPSPQPPSGAAPQSPPPGPASGSDAGSDAPGGAGRPPLAAAPEAPQPPSLPASSEAPSLEPSATPPAQQPSAPPSAPPATPAAPPSAPTPFPPPKAVILCRLAEIDRERVHIAQELAQSVGGVRLAIAREAAVDAWWVTTPRQANEKAARALAETLRQQGVNDLFIIRDPGPHQWRISLGIFRTRERAERLVAELRRRGVTAVELLPRERSPKVTITVEGAQPLVDRFLGRARARLPEVTWQECAR